MRNRWPILALLCVLASLLAGGIASAHAASGAENRVWGFDLAEQIHVGGQRALTPELHQGYELAEYDSASGSLLAARGGTRAPDFVVTPRGSDGPSKGPTTNPEGGPDAAKGGGKAFSKEKGALVDMAKGDKRTGMTSGDMQAYKDLNKGLPDPFPANKVRGPEVHPPRTPNSPPGPGQQPHGHVGPVNHIPINGG